MAYFIGLHQSQYSFFFKMCVFILLTFFCHRGSNMTIHAKEYEALAMVQFQLEIKKLVYL